MELSSNISIVLSLFVLASMLPLIPISGICERDIDLLLLEEFIASFDFLQWFVGQISKSSIEVECLLNAQRSVTQSNGESDLEITLQDSDGNQVCLLIENKVNASLQPQQAERYRERGQIYLVNEHCTKFCTVLVAPERYFNGATDSKEFDTRVTYEAIRSWFTNHQNIGDRGRYKELLLTGAIEKGTLGYQAIADAAVSDFWQGYWRLAQKFAPELEMRRPEAKPASSNFIYFHPSSLPKGIDIVHKLPHGNVDLQFQKMGERLGELKSQFDNYIDSDISFAKAGKSGSVRLKVQTINVAVDFTQQQENILRGLEAAKRLLILYGKSRL